MKDFITKVLVQYLAKLTINYGPYIVSSYYIFESQYMNMVSHTIDPVMMTRIAVFLAFTIIYFSILLLVKKQKNNKKEKTVEYLKETINKCREIIDENHKLNKEKFRVTSVYSKLRPFVSKRFKENIESGAIIIAVGNGRGAGNEHFKTYVLDELVKIERKFNII